ncbi:TIGR02186 family protein [Rickettsiales bacterium]|nr:TIGR02186 family protein [Rickettsiales bacterium]
MKKISILLTVILLFTFNSQSFARPLIADLSLRKISIDSGFTGTDILLFGARNDAGDVVVVVRGPKRPYIVRKKEKLAGIWVNSKQVTFNDVQGFYTVASNRPLKDLKNSQLLESLEIGYENVSLINKNAGNLDVEPFKKALLDDKKNKKLYNPTIEEVKFTGETLFRAIINFPENIQRGTYSAEVYLFSDGQLIGMQTTPLLVYKTGFDAWVFDFAHNSPALYGLSAILLALAGGWAAGLIFRKVS